MNALEFARERLAGYLPDTLGVELLRVDPEVIEARLLVRKEICTPGDILHGGAIMAFADTLGAIGTVINLREGQWTTTLESKTNFFAGAPLGTTVIGTSRPLHRGRRTMVWETVLANADAKTIAKVTQTQMVLDAG